MGCPYNGSKLEIMQYLGNLNGDFTNRERELLSLGLLRLMHESDHAAVVIDSDAVRSALKSYRDELQALNIKVLDMED